MAAATKSRKEESRQWASAGRSAFIANATTQSTDSLIRKVLCQQAHTSLTESQQPIDQILPPLTSSNEVDTQLYAIIAVVMRDFVFSWYGKITPDQSFVEESIRIIAHCTRDIEDRLRKVNLEALILHEIPQIFELHIKAFRIAHAEQIIPNSSCPEIIYHSLFPHPGLSPAPEQGLLTVEQVKNEAFYRQLLVQGVLAVLLPSEDVRNPCLRTLVSDVIADMILGNGVGGKASSGWLIWDGIAKALGDESDKSPHSSGDALDLEKSSLGDGLARSSSNRQETILNDTHVSRYRKIPSLFWSVVQAIYLVVIGFRYLLVGLWIASRVTSSRVKKSNHQTPPMTSEISSAGRPILMYSIFGVLSQLLELHIRMPWITGGASLVRYHLVDGSLRVTGVAATFDRFLHASIQRLLQRSDLLPQMLLLVRSAIFPNNALGPSKPVPPVEEQRRIKRRAAVAILSKIPRFAASLYLGKAVATFEPPNMELPPETGHQPNVSRPQPVDTSPGKRVNNSKAASPGSQSVREQTLPVSPAIGHSSDKAMASSILLREAQLRDIEGFLDLFSNQYMNKHMIYSIIELIVVRLVPELQGESTKGLLERRIRLG